MRWKFFLGIILLAILIVTGWFYQNRSEAVYQRIIHQDGYTLSLVKEDIAVEFFLKPEWIPERDGEEKLLNLVIERKFDTEIVLEKVAKREKDFYIQLNAVPHPNRTSGQLLSTSLISNGSFSSSGSFTKWQVTDAAGNDLLGGSFGAGEGPDNFSSLFIDDAVREKFAQGAHVRYSGYYLYGYQQVRGDYEKFWLPILITALSLVVLAVLYRKRSESENGLAWKLVGYWLLGGFTFSLNDIRLPLGFVVCWLFFRKPKPNEGIKHKAALLGLLFYVSQLITPGMIGVLGLKPGDKVIRDVSIEQLGLDGLWKMIAVRAPISGQARLQSFETVISSDGEVKELAFHFVDRDERGRFIHTEAVYDVSGHSVVLERSLTDEWLQFPRQISASYFIDRVQNLNLMDLKPSGDDHPLVKLRLLEDGTRVNYGMKDAQTFGVDGKGVYKIREEQLPVLGYLMLVCGGPQTTDPVHGCKDSTYYLFDIMGPIREAGGSG